MSGRRWQQRVPDVSRSPRQLLDDYAAGDFFFATGEYTLLASGSATALTSTELGTLDERAAAALSAAANPIAVGALPFEPGGAQAPPGHLVLPRILRLAGPAHPEAAALPEVPVPKPSRVHAVPAPEHHRDAIAAAVRLLDSAGLRKVVLARALDLEFDEQLPVDAILRNLVRENPAGYTFGVGLPGDRAMLGASPELLISRTGSKVFAYPHAGSMPRSPDPRQDAVNGRALLASTKDHAEHAVLTEAVEQTLRPLCARLDVPAEPELVSTPTMWHLGTTITGELADLDITALRLAAALHPTPAVCGTPTDTARRVLGELEPFDRGYYAGAVGWVDAQGDGEWAVAIRCAEIAQRALRLYAGGGIVEGSEPAAELDETSAKFVTLLRAMGLES